MEGDSNGAIHAPITAYRSRFSGKMTAGLSSAASATTFRRKPQAFAQAVIDVNAV
jgi:hypothetical protein